MKTIQKFLTENPSYCKCSATRISKRTGISVNTVQRARNTEWYKSLSIDYRTNA